MLHQQIPGAALVISVLWAVLQTEGKYLACQPDWLAHQSSCFLVKRIPVTWLEGQASCRQLGAELASVSGEIENDFVWSQLPKGANRGFWLGLNDRQNQTTFVWSDLSPVTFTRWMNNEPNNFNVRNGDCVRMHAETGEWSDESCDQLSSGYVCKQPMTVMDTPTFNPQQIGCPVGGFGYESSCYVVVDIVKTWQDANDYCRNNKGDLVTITNRIIGAFITSELVDKTASYWIGLSSTNGDLTWSSGQMVNYTDWAPSYYGPDPDVCVALRTQRPVGLWEVLNCQEVRPFICELWRSEYPTTTTSTTTTSTDSTTSTRTTTSSMAITIPPTTIGNNSTIALPPAVPPAPAKCPKSWKFISDKCYRVYTGPKKSWLNARAFCRRLGGDLASIHQNLDLKNQLSFSGLVWIGLNDRDKEGVYKWSDNTVLNYRNWGPHEPNNAGHNEDCVQLTPEQTWNDDPCQRLNSFLCAIKPNIPVTTPTTIATTQAPVCADAGWRYFRGFCYFISPRYGVNTSLTWYEARRFCQASGGDLASITSDSVTNFLTASFTAGWSMKCWIGFNQIGHTKYRWSDGTPVTYTLWAAYEPNDAYGGEMCVAMFTDSGFWSDQHCSQKNRFICKKLNDSSSPVVPTQAPVIPGVCPDGFFHMGVTNKCFYIGGVGSSPKLSWTDARDKCRSMTSPNPVDIATISSRMEQDVVTVGMEHFLTDIWIGLNTMVSGFDLKWQDNSEFLFSYWASTESENSYYFRNTCVKMLGNTLRGSDIAHWGRESCNIRHAYLCQTMSAPIPTRSALATTPQATTANNKCPPNFFSHSDTCFSVVKQPKSWKDARTTCQAMKGELASTLSVYEVARLDIAMAQAGVSDPAWIGLYYNVGYSSYMWSDNWPMTQTFWTSSDPDFQTNSSCVAFSQGFWNDTSCSELRPFVCETRPVEVTHAPPTGDCPNPKTKPYGSWCYLIDAKRRLSMPESVFACAQQGMQLVSVHSKSENKFLRDLVDSSHTEKIYDLHRLNIWLGFQRDSKGAFRWSDGSLDDYFNWDHAEPNSKPGSSRTTLSTYDEQCVELNFRNGKWNDVDCMKYSLGYVCKSKQVFPSTVTTTSGPTTRPATTPTPTKMLTTTPTKMLKTTPTPTKMLTKAQTPRNNPTTFTPTLASRKQPTTTTSSSTFKTSSNKDYASSSNSNMAPGSVAGTVIGVLCAVSIAIVVAFIIWKKKLYKPTNVQSAQGFSNALYARHVDKASLT